MKDVLKCIIIMAGEQCVIHTLMTHRQVLPAALWVSGTFSTLLHSCIVIIIIY